MALVELTQMNDSKIAVLLGVPPFLVGLPSGGDSLTYSTTVQLFDFHWRSGLRPKATAVMAALSGWLLPRGTTVEVNQDSYIQPGPYERAQTAEIYSRIVDAATGQPVMSVAEIREAERLDDRTTDIVVGPGGASAMSERPPGEMLFRDSTVTGVSFAQRLIELVVVPYDEETLVEHRGPHGQRIRRARRVRRNRGRPNRVKANRDHKLERTVGKAVAFYPDRDEGLVAELKISDTELGKETLVLADDGCLGASAGYLPMEGGENWLTRTKVRMTRCWLGHVALTPDPAYAGAQVLSVRQNASQGATGPPDEEPETPNLDVVRGWLMDERYERLRAEL